MLLWNEYRRNPLVLGLHETIDRYMKLDLQQQHAFEQFFLLFGTRFVWVTDCYAIRFILSYDGNNPLVL